MKIKPLLTASLLLLAAASQALAAPLRIAYSDWPGWTLLEVPKQKGWFKEAGVDVEMVWFDYGPSMDAFSAGKVDAVTVVPSDAMVMASNGAKSKFVAVTDFSDGNDKIVGKAGINSIKDLKGQKIGIEQTLVEHLLLLQALKANGMKQADVTLVQTATNDTPQTLNSGSVAAIGAWYPVSTQALTLVAGSKALFTSHDLPGLIYDVIAVNPTSYAKHKEDWEKVAQVYYKAVAYLQDPATHDDAVAIMAAKVGVKAEDYAKNIPGTHYLTLAEAKKVLVKGEGLDSLYGSMTLGNQFNLDNGVYKKTLKPEEFILPHALDKLK